METKQGGSWWHTVITPVLPVAGRKFLQYFAHGLELLKVFQNYLLIPQFFAEPHEQKLLQEE